MRWKTLGSIAFLLTASVVSADPASTAPCSPSSADSPISDQTVATFATASHVASAIQEVPTKDKDRRLFEITLSAQYSGGAPKTFFVDLTQDSYNQLMHYGQLGYQQAVNDVEDATILFMKATDQWPCAPGVKVCGPQTLAQYETFLQSQSAKLSPNAKALFASMLGRQLDKLYHVTSGITPLPTVFQSLVTNAQNAGECRDIATFIAVSMKAMGLKNAGVVGADWHSDIGIGSHVVAQYQDPATGHYVFVNYDDAFDSGDTILSEAAQKAALNLNPYTSSVMVQSVDMNGSGKMHETISPRTLQIQNGIERASDPDNPTFQLDIGNLEGSASAKAQILGGDNNNVVLFGVGNYNRQGDAYNSITAGARLDAGGQFNTSQNTALTLKGFTANGIMNLQDTMPVGDANAVGRNETLYFTNSKGEVNWGWNESGQSGNSGHIGLQGTATDAIYASYAAGNTPYDTVTLSAVDNPSKSFQIHLSSTGYFAQTTQQNINPGFHAIDQAAGVKLSKSFGGDRSDVSNDTTYHYFQKGAFGLTNTTQLTLGTGRWGSVVVKGEVGYVRNTSGDAFYDYPLTCSISMQYEKSIGHATVNVGGTHRCNQHNSFSLFQMTDPAFAGDVDGLITPPRENFGFNVRF